MTADLVQGYPWERTRYVAKQSQAVANAPHIMSGVLSALQHCEQHGAESMILTHTRHMSSSVQSILSPCPAGQRGNTGGPGAARWPRLAVWRLPGNAANTLKAFLCFLSFCCVADAAVQCLAELLQCNVVRRGSFHIEVCHLRAQSSGTPAFGGGAVSVRSSDTRLSLVLQYRESPPRLLPATVDEEAAWAAGYGSALPFGE